MVGSLTRGIDGGSDRLDQVGSLVSGLAHALAYPMKYYRVFRVRLQQFHSLVRIGQFPVEPALGPILR